MSNKFNDEVMKRREEIVKSLAIELGVDVSVLNVQQERVLGMNDAFSAPYGIFAPPMPPNKSVSGSDNTFISGLPKPTRPAPPMPPVPPCKPSELRKSDVKMQDARVALSYIYKAVEEYKEACDTGGGDPDGTWKKVEEAMDPALNWLIRDATEASARCRRLAKVEKPINEFTQRDVDQIVRRARELGSGKGCDHKSGQFNLGIYHMRSPEENLGYLLVNAWDGKYDLIHAVTALIEHFTGNKTED